MMNYQAQAYYNADVFDEYEEYSEKKQLLKELINRFRNAGIKWTLTCSSNLFFRGIVDIFNDYDILISKDSVPAFKQVMEDLQAKSLPQGDQSAFNSTWFARYEVGNVGIDVISEWRIVTFGTTVLFEYTQEEIDIEQGLPLIAMERQFLLYAMMEGWQPQRQYKRILCENYLKYCLRYPGIIKDAVSDPAMPIPIKKRCRMLLKM